MNFAIGTKFIDRDQPPLTAEEKELIGRFHDLYYRRWQKHGGDTIDVSWFGHIVRKCPLDLWVYQELLVRSRPDLVIETGTLYGGSALFMASLMDIMDHGRVITIDRSSNSERPRHPRIGYWTGSSVEQAIVRQAQEAAVGRRVMIILDSDHSADHVFQEIVCYSPLVQLGDYLIVEDTNVNGHPTYAEFGPGPMEAVERFLAWSNEFMVDERCERFLVTMNPKGYLKRVRPAKKAG